MNTKKISEHISAWMRTYAQNARMQGFILGVSGGIDSAVVSAMAARTGMKTLLLTLPIHQKQNQTDRGLEHINHLKAKYSNVESLHVDLTPFFDSLVTAVQPDYERFENTALALANARSRMRMVTLYYYAQINGLIVAGTGNKIEDYGVGFFTKYGDGGVDISPIGDLTKTQVYALAEELDIVESIRRAIPTDGLFDEERTDEDQLGASYPELEWAMTQYGTHTAADFTGREKQVFEIYTQRHRANLHKINPIPVCTIPREWL